MKLIQQLDITPTMYKNADEKYHAIANFLNDSGIDAEMYPQGSFAFGTVVRPNAKDPDADYDLDFICQLNKTRDDIAPSELRNTIGDALQNSDRYNDKLTVWPECFTVEYADINGVGFKIDIVPATDESSQHKQELMVKCSRPDLIGTSIAIPRENGERNYQWLTNNPKGFLTWFNEINAPFLAHKKEARRAKYFAEHSRVFASVEDIPDGLDRSALQRVIQILKYHRDIFYLRYKDDDLKPISAIINVLCAAIAKSANPQLDTFELLSYVLHELDIYSKQQTMSFQDFRTQYSAKNILTRNENKQWVLQNPANPEDNLVNKWNTDSRIPEYFFRWTAACKKDLVVALSLDDPEFRTAMENAFGAKTIQRAWGDKYKEISRPAPTPILNTSKPYRELK